MVTALILKRKWLSGVNLHIIVEVLEEREDLALRQYFCDQTNMLKFVWLIKKKYVYSFYTGRKRSLSKRQTGVSQVSVSFGE